MKTTSQDTHTHIIPLDHLTFIRQPFPVLASFSSFDLLLTFDRKGLVSPTRIPSFQFTFSVSLQTMSFDLVPALSFDSIPSLVRQAAYGLLTTCILGTAVYAGYRFALVKRYLIQRHRHPELNDQVSSKRFQDNTEQLLSLSSD